MGITTQFVACLYEDSKYFPCFSFTDTHMHTHTHTTRMKRGVERVMDTPIVVLADRLPVPHCYDANHHNTTVFKVGSNAHAQACMHTYFTNLQFVMLTEIICEILNSYVCQG